MQAHLRRYKTSRRLHGIQPYVSISTRQTAGGVGQGNTRRKIASRRTFEGPAEQSSMERRKVEGVHDELALQLAVVRRGHFER